MLFHIILEKAENDWIVAKCPALPGCVSQGKSDKEAIENIKEAIIAWLWTEDHKAINRLQNSPERQEPFKPLMVTV